MAKLSKKHEANLGKVQSMVDGTFGSEKIQVGMHTSEDIHANRKVGDKWTDSDGVQWEQKNGYRSKVSVMPDVGMFHQQCKVCDTNCSLEKRHKHTWVRYERCYHCQMNFELDLSFDKPIRWFAYRRLKDFENMKSIEKDLEQWVEERHKKLQENPFDKSVANAMANSNVEMTINKNKS